MRFPGYWIDGQGDDVTLQFALFDDTELTPESDWKQSYQNDDEGLPWGFVDPLSALRDVCSRVRRGDGPSGEETIETGIDEIFRIQNADDLALVTLQLLDRLPVTYGQPVEREAK